MPDVNAESSRLSTPDPKSPPPNSLRGVMLSLSPEWELEDWFHWPPDLFALTSLLLKTTGAYRFAVSPPKEPWPATEDWQGEVETSAKHWWEWIAGGNTLPPLIGRALTILADLQFSIDIEQIRSFCRNPTQSGKAADEDCWMVCRSLLELHAVADEACHGFGLPHAEQEDSRCAMCFLANMLLVSTGSLSRLPQYKVMVLPKMRTPQVGLTLRSLSHHVTVHQSEVEVVWRTMPWINSDEETINIMIVPWPPKFKQTWVKPEYHSVNRNSSEPARYFTIKRGKEDRLPVDRVLAMLKSSSSQVNRVHILVFPELALDKPELDDLKSALAGELPRDQMPMIITGLREEGKGSDLGRNKVILSAFFAGKWYDLVQDKHHRWKLDENQIRQYNLGGVLSSARDWWEAIEIPDRRLTFLSPNGWLTLCPLICEDLGRLEPVSELIRGVGPTLLIAILLDGPQVRQRWPGRYASVLADDPGTSVLTVSARGMVDSSIPIQGQEKMDGVIGLWKDQITGWREIRLGKQEDAKILTITASWTQEYTADGRGDGAMAAVFSLQGEHSVAVDPVAPPVARRRTVLTGEDVDLRELATFTFFADAALDTSNDIVKNLEQWALNRQDHQNDWLSKGFRPKESILNSIRMSDLGYRDSGAGSEEFEQLLSVLTAYIKSVDRDSRSYKSELVKKANEILLAARYNPRPLHGDKTPDHLSLRAEIYSALAILWAVHKRLADSRRKSGLTSQTEDLLNDIEQLLPQKYDEQWYAARAADKNAEEV